MTQTGIEIEMLKIRRSFANNISWWFPVISVILIFVLSGQQVLVHLYNWWIVIIMPLLLALINAPLCKIDDNAGVLLTKTILMRGADSWYAKMTVATLLFLRSSLILLLGSFVIVAVCRLLNFDIVEFSILDCTIVTLLIYLVNLWQIPIIYMIADKLNLWGAIAYVIITNGIIGFSSSSAGFWLISPWSYVYKIESFCLGISPNGLYDGINRDWPFFPIAEMTIVSIALAILSIYLGKRWYLSRV